MKEFIYSLLFYLFITPIGLIARLFGVKFIDKGFDNSKDTYWEKTEKMKRSKKDFYKSEY